MTIHANSIKSKREIKVFKRREEILNAYKLFPDGTTDRGILHFLGYSEMNQVRPRISEMIEEKHLVECGSTKDETTGRTVRVVRLAKRFFGKIQDDLFS